MSHPSADQPGADRPQPPSTRLRMPLQRRSRALLPALLLACALPSHAGTSQTPPLDTASEDTGTEALTEAPDQAGAISESEELAQRAAAREVVQRLHDAILETMKRADELGFQGRYDKMYAVVNATFDLPFMARTSLGRQWRELDDDAHERWLELSRRLSATNYAYNFDGYAGEQFVTISAEPGIRDTIRVQTKLVTRMDPDVQFDYRVRQRKDGWRIIDIQLDGTVSELALRRADYASTIKRAGFEQLVTDLEQKIAEMSGKR